MQQPVTLLMIGSTDAENNILRVRLQELGYSAALLNAQSVESLNTLADAHAWDLVFVYHPEDQAPLETLVEAIRRCGAIAPFLVIADPYDSDQAIQALNVGIFRYLPAERLDLHLLASVRAALEYTRARRQVRESEDRYRAVSELTTDYAYSLVVRPDGAVELEWITDAFTRMLGLSVDEVRKQGGINKRVHPEDLAEVNRHHACWLAGQTDTCEYRLFDRDQQIHWLRDTGRPVWSESEQRVVRIVGASQEITRRKQAEIDLRESEQKYRTLFETMDQGVVYLDLQGKILAVNPAAESILGVKSPDILIRTTNDPKWDAIHADGSPFPGEDHPVTIAAKTGRVVKNVAMGVCNPVTGQLRWIRITAVPQFRPGETSPYQVYAIFHDYTEWKNAGQALRESEERFRAVFESSDIGIFMTEPDGKILQINPAFCEIFGYTAEALPGIRLTDLSHPEYLSSVMALQEDLLAGNRDSGTLDARCIRSDGEILWGRLSVSMVRDSESRPLFAINMIEDITQRRAADEELLQALEKERELSDLKSRFISMVSHEFRTPLSTILSSAELIEHYGSDWTEKKKTDHLHRIQSAVQMLTGMLEEILVIGKANAGKMAFSPAPVDMVNLIEGLIEGMGLGVGQTHPIVFENRSDNLVVISDEKLLHVIIANLVSNSMKYSPAKSPIHINLITQAGEIRIEVKDQGIGIPEKDLEHLYEPFYRGRNVSHIPGTGLGLTIVKNSLELLGGRIEIASGVGKGTCFRVIIPPQEWQDAAGQEPIRI